MFSTQNQPKLGQNILKTKREEFRSDIRKKQIEKIVTQQMNLNPQQIIEDFESSQVKDFEQLFDLSAANQQSNINLTFLLNYGILAKLIPYLAYSDKQLVHIYGILGNLSTIEEYRLQDEKLIIQTLDFGFQYLQQKIRHFPTIDNILVYIANLSDASQQLSQLYMQHSFMVVLLKLSNEIFNIVKDPNNQTKQQAELTMSNIFYVLFTVIKTKLKVNEEIIIFEIIRIGVSIVTDELRYEILTLINNILENPTESCISIIIESKLLKFIVDSLQSQTYNLALKVIKMITSFEPPIIQDHKPCQLLIELGILEQINIHLSNRQLHIRTDCYLILSNLSYTNQEIIGYILTHQVMKRLFNVLIIERDQEQIYAMASIVNILNIATQQQYEVLIQMGLIQILAKLLQNDHSKLLEYVLSALQSLCNYGREIQIKSNSKQNNIVRELRLLNVTPYLERLQKHKSILVFQAVEILLVSFFNYQTSDDS